MSFSLIVVFLCFTKGGYGEPKNIWFKNRERPGCFGKAAEVKFMNVKKDDNIAEIVGLAFGDGSLTRRKATKQLRFQLRGHATEDRPHYDDYVISLINKALTLPLAGKEVSVVESRKKNKSYGVAIQDSSVVGPFLHSCGIPISKKAELYIPAWIRNDKNKLVFFLRGFFDTYGTVYCQKNYSLRKPKRHTQIRIKLSTTSKGLALDLARALATLNIKSLLKTQLKKRGEKTPYYVEISGGLQADSWFKIIGSRNPKHTTKYWMWQKFGFCPPFTTLAQRKRMLSGSISPELFYSNRKNHAEVTEPGQMCKVEVSKQKPCPLVGARVRIASSASS